MLLPSVWLRKRSLEPALRDYPAYDPPHKVEERLLPREKAAENFEYFMRVRQQRLQHFQSWLRDNFGVTLEPNEKGVRALNLWGNNYAGLLLLPGSVPHSYFTYDPAWTGDNVGCNVVFDMGIALGEFIIATCPKLHWDFDTVSAVQPHKAKQWRQTPGASFHRPTLTGFDNPIFRKIPLHDVYIFSQQMFDYTTTFKGQGRYNRASPQTRLNIRDQLMNMFRRTLADYPAGDPYKLREQMGPEAYSDYVDSPYVEEDDDHEWC